MTAVIWVGQMRPQGIRDSSVDPNGRAVLSGPSTTTQEPSNKVSLRERSTGARFQVTLELDCTLDVREPDRRDELPRAVGNCVYRPSRVVGFETSGHVGREADVIAGRVDQTTKNVDEAVVERHDQAERAIGSPA